MQLNSLGFPRIGRRRELKFALENTGVVRALKLNYVKWRANCAVPIGSGKPQRASSKCPWGILPFMIKY